MDALGFDRLSYFSGSQRTFLISGEIHYFRVPRNAWRDRLQKMKDAGGNCIATYVPWLLHEPQEGTFNFEGQYDVNAFLDLCREVGIWAVVRPGPYQYSELVCDGLPIWLCENYPQLRAKRPDGTDIRFSSISYMHPLFLQKARTWYDVVIPKLARHQISRGGAVVGMQFDNELAGIHEWFGDWDYNPDTFAIGQDAGRWPDFLKKRYGELSTAAAAHGKPSASAWRELVPQRDAGGTPEGRRIVKDYQDCYFQQVADYASTLVSWMRTHGVDVPMVHNAANAKMNACFVETVRDLGPQFILGSDNYYTLGLSWAQNNPTPQYAVTTYASIEMLRLMGMPPTMFEMPGGSCSDFPPVAPEDAACCYLSHIGMGLKGYNYYIFAGGPNPPEAGTTTDIYDYGAAVSATGELRPLYFVQQKLARFLHDHAWLAGAHALTDCHLGFDFEVIRAMRYASDSTGLLLPASGAYEFLRNGVLMTAFCAGISPGFADLRTKLTPDGKPLMVASWDCMSRSIQQNMVDYLSAGGKLLLLGVVPTMDENLNPCTLLADAIGARPQARSTARLSRLNAYGVENVFVNKSLFTFAGLPSSATVTAQQVRSPAGDVGFLHTLPTGGVASILGFVWDQAQREHEAMLRGALAQLGWRPVVASSNPNVWLTVRTDGKQSMAFIHNYLSAPMTTHLRYTDPATGQWTDLGERRIPGITVQAIVNGKPVTLSPEVPSL